MAIKVRNINGTSDYKCKCGSWLDHWKNYSRQEIPTYCSEATCTGKDLVGAHVQKDSFFDNNWYIIPLCNKHNQSSSSLSVVDSTTFVSANRSETCD